MPKRIITGESQDTLKSMSGDELKMFNEIRNDEDMWEAIKQFSYSQKQIKLDQMYRLRRPKTQDDVINNAIRHEYYAGRIAGLVVLLQIIENAGNELQQRERKAKKK